MTLTRDPQHIPQYGVFEFSLAAEENDQHPSFETDFTVVFARPNVDGDSVAHWFDPRTGLWRSVLEISAGMQTLLAPEGGDWVLLLRRRMD